MSEKRKSDRPASADIGELQTGIHSTLESLPAGSLEAITAYGDTFAGAQWYRMLDRLDLSDIMGGEIDLKFAVTSADGTPVALCPLVRARGSDLGESYNFRRYYFESWIEQARRLYPDGSQELERSIVFVSRYRRLLEWMNCSLDDYVIVLSPFSQQSNIAMTRCSPERHNQVLRHMIESLKHYAKRQNRPLWFRYVDGNSGLLRRSLQAAGFQPVFLHYDNRIDLSEFNDFNDYLQVFSPVTRQGFLREMRRSAKAGIQFRFADDFSKYARAFSELSYETSSKYYTSARRLPPDFWTTLSDSLGSNAEALLAEHDGRLVGFSLLLKNDRRREMFHYKIGRIYKSALNKVPYYFELLCYGPVRRAIELGYRTLWLGPGAYEGKIRRGTEQTSVYSYLWFPRRRDRWLLRPYVREFGETVRREIPAQAKVPLRIRDDDVSVPY